MFQLDILTITWRMRKLSLQNHTTVYQKGLQCCRPRHQPCPLGLQGHSFLPPFQMLAEFALYVREKNSNSLAGICIKHCIKGAGNPICCFARGCNTASMLPLRGKPTSQPATPFFGALPREPIRRKFCYKQRLLTAFVVKELKGLT